MDEVIIIPYRCALFVGCIITGPRPPHRTLASATRKHLLSQRERLQNPANWYHLLNKKRSAMSARKGESQ